MELSMEADDDHNCSDYQRPKITLKKKKLCQGIFSYCMENTSHMAKGVERTTKDFSLPFLRH